MSIDDSKMDQSQKQARAYLLAKRSEISNKEESCSLYTSLSKDISFALYQLAQIKRMKVCELSKEELIEIWESSLEIPKWLEKEFIETSLNLASKHSIPKYHAQFTYERSFYLKTQTQKIEALKEAISIEQRAKNENSDIYKDQLYLVSPSLSPKSTWDKGSPRLYEVARDFEKTRKFKQARKLYKELITKEDISSELYIKTWNRIRLSYKVQRDKKEYVAQTHKMISSLKSLLGKRNKDNILISGLHKTQINLARAVWTQGNRSKAKKILKKLLSQDIKDLRIKANGLWVLGGIYLEEENKEEALKTYLLASGISFTGDESLQYKIIWSVGWNLYLQKKYKESQEYFLSKIDTFKDESDKNKFRFWAAKALQKIGKKTEANEIYRVISNSSFSYYGILAHKELKVPLAPIHSRDLDIRAPFYNIFAWLIQLSEYELSRKFLDSISYSGDKERLSHLPLFPMAKYYSKNIRNFFNLSIDSRSEVLEANPKIPYPLPYEDLIEELTRKRDLSRGLIPAIIRQESAFDHNARSWADAYGLMQIIPERAKSLARKEGIPFKEYEDLYKERLNITLGSRLLSDLKNKYNSFIPFYVAAYNAGETPVNRWKKERFKGNELEYVEMIPYGETQKYVKLVFRNLIIYKRMLESSPIHLHKNLFNY